MGEAIHSLFLFAFYINSGYSICNLYVEFVGNGLGKIYWEIDYG